MKSSRSSSSPTWPGLPSMYTCQMRGWVTLANLPTTSFFTGTWRQPRTLRPSLVATSSKIFLHSASSLSSLGRNSMPTPVVASLRLGFSFLSSFQGIWVINPAPSPESSSAEHAPRCSMHPKAVRACSTTLWLLTFFRLAMKPTPQASLSCRMVSRSAAWHLTCSTATGASSCAAVIADTATGLACWIGVCTYLAALTALSCLLAAR
mmetsp:Transcript_22031/g.48086  ORF Transcript_22031/g.48086 Transcript_22031/m.48086 type:complete len:207 (-) Transcript_22031:201-821(-)